MSVVVDNASNNFTAIRELKLMLPDESILDEDTAIRCLCHIFNLVVKVRLLFFHIIIRLLTSVHPPYRL